MDAPFIIEAFKQMGEHPIRIKFMFNKYTEVKKNYAFIEFYNTESVIKKLNGKIIPNTNPVSHTLILILSVQFSVFIDILIYLPNFVYSVNI